MRRVAGEEEMADEGCGVVVGHFASFPTTAVRALDDGAGGGRRSYTACLCGVCLSVCLSCLLGIEIVIKRVLGEPRSSVVTGSLPPSSIEREGVHRSPVQTRDEGAIGAPRDRLGL